jgi:hypothetical protein
MSNDSDNDNGTGTNDNGSTTGSSAEFVFAAIGDYGDDDDNSRAMANMVKGWGPDFIITVGDNDYTDGAFRGSFEGLELGVGQFFYEYIGDYQGAYGEGSIENRFFPTPGDHDWGDTCEDRDGLDDYLAYFTLPADNSGTERYYDFRWGHVHFFALHSIEDCEPDGADTDSSQARWVERRARASDATFKVAYFHNPPHSSGANHVRGGVHMRWPWADWGFDVVMSGDDHVYERLELDGVIYVISGFGGVDLHPFVDDPVEGSLVRFNQEYGAVRVEVFADRLDVISEAVDGRVIDEFSITSD